MRITLPQLARISRSGRWIAFGAVFLLCIIAFASGVVTSERPELGTDPWIAWVYYAGGLFVFGGLDPFGDFDLLLTGEQRD